jgi:hypothetical protein
VFGEIHPKSDSDLSGLLIANLLDKESEDDLHFGEDLQFFDLYIFEKSMAY